MRVIVVVVTPKVVMLKMCKKSESTVRTVAHAHWRYCYWTVFAIVLGTVGADASNATITNSVFVDGL
jgi:hypothetical protein